MDSRKKPDVLTIPLLPPVAATLTGPWRGLRDGDIPWTSARELTRIATAADDARLADLGRRRTTAEIERMVVRSPRAYEKDKAERDRAEKSPGGDRPAAAGEAAGTLFADVPSESDADSGAPEPPPETGPSRDAAASSETASPPAPALPPARIKLEFRLTPQDYEAFKDLAQRVVASHRGPMSRDDVFTEICRRAAGGDATKAKRRTVVVVHYDRPDGAAWMETDRGVVPIPPDDAEAALQQGHVVVAAGAPTGAATPAEPTSAASTATAAPPPEDSTVDSPAPQEAHEQPVSAARAPQRKPRAKPRRRQKVTGATLDALYARSNGRCEHCGRRGFLHVHHRKPWSRGGDNSLEVLQLICTACHTMFHRRDFETGADWAAARDRARAARRAKGPQAPLVGAPGP